MAWAYLMALSTLLPALLHVLSFLADVFLRLPEQHQMAFLGRSDWTQRDSKHETYIEHSSGVMALRILPATPTVAALVWNFVQNIAAMIASAGDLLSDQAASGEIAWSLT